MHISLTPELEALVHKKVESGMYNNASEVIREALRLMHLSEMVLYQTKLTRLQNAIQAGFDSGESPNSVLDILKELEEEHLTAKRVKNPKKKK